MLSPDIVKLSGARSPDIELSEQDLPYYIIQENGL